MHELALCRALIASAERELARFPGRSLRGLKVSVGALSGCEPDLLSHLFPHASPGTVAANASLEIDFQPVQIRCAACAVESGVPSNDLRCPACGCMSVSLTAGDGVFLTGLILREEAHVQ